MKRFNWMIVFGMMILPGVVHADFSFYWRDQNALHYEYRHLIGLDLNNSSASDSVGNSRAYSTFRLRMKPSMSITDRLLIHSLFDAYVSPNNTVSQEEGAQAGGQATDTNNYGPSLGSLPRSIFGGSNGYGTSAFTAGDSNFIIKSLFMEYIGDWGILKLGRIPRHWGLGIRYNEGLNPNDKFTDRTDTAMYELGLGNIKLAVLLSKVLESNLNRQSDDMTLYETYLHYNQPEKDMDVGAMYTFMRQSVNFVKLSIIDLYAKKKYKKIRAGVELVTSLGSPGSLKGSQAAQLGLATELAYDWTPSISTFLNLGYASQADIDRGGRLQLFAFDRNYDIAFLMFNQPMGSISAQTGISASSDPDTNALFGAYYLNLAGAYHFNDRIGTKLGFTTAQSPLPLVAGGGKFYGQELDATLWYHFVENWNLGVDAGVFMPGNLYEGDPTNKAKIDPAYGVQAYTTISF